MKNEIAKKETVAVEEWKEQESWGSEGIDASDILIPKILLMQGQSDFVGAEKANVGDIVLSTSAKLLAKRGDSLEIIPICSTKGWRIMEKEKDRFEFRRNEPLTPENKNRDLDWEQNGTQWRADRTLNFFVLLPQDIRAEKEAMILISKGETPNFTHLLTPCLLQFMRTSYNAGKALITHFAMASHFKQPPARWYLKLSAKSVKNDLGTFYVFDVASGGISEPEHVLRAREWYDIIRSSGDIKIHEADTTAESPAGETPPREMDIANPSDKF